MAARAFFISETYLKDNSPLSGNIDINEIYPFAKTVEQIYVQEAIGTTLYDDLITKINLDNDLSGYPNELVLCRKIRDMVLWYTVFEALPFIATKIRNIGVVKQEGENLVSADRDAIADLRKICQDKAKFFEKRLQDYLCEFDDLFHAYDTGNDDELPPNTQTPSIGLDIAFDKSIDDDYSRFYRKWLRS